MKANELPADIRREKGLSVEAIAATMGTSKSSVSAFETGKSEASEGLIERWAAAVGVGYSRAYRARYRAVRAHGRALVRESQSRLAGAAVRRRGLDSSENRL